MASALSCLYLPIGCSGGVDVAPLFKGMVVVCGDGGDDRCPGVWVVVSGWGVEPTSPFWLEHPRLVRLRSRGLDGCQQHQQQQRQRQQELLPCWLPACWSRSHGDLCAAVGEQERQMAGHAAVLSVQQTPDPPLMGVPVVSADGSEELRTSPRVI